MAGKSAEHGGGLGLVARIRLGIEQRRSYDAPRYSQESVQGAIADLKEGQDPVTGRLISAMVGIMKVDPQYTLPSDATDDARIAQEQQLRAIAAQRINGEFNRSGRLWPFWQFFSAFDFLGPKRAADLGSALWIQHASKLIDRVQERIGLDLPAMAAAGRVALERFKEVGKAREVDEIIPGNAAEVPPLQVDSIDADLVAMYLDPELLAQMLLRHSKTIGVGGLLHGDFEVPGIDLTTLKPGDRIPLYSSKPDANGELQPTGIFLEITGEIHPHVNGMEDEAVEGILGKSYGFRVVPDEWFSDSDSDVRYLHTSDKQTGVLQIVDGKVVPWAILPKPEARQEQLVRAAAFRRVLLDIFRRREGYNGNNDPFVGDAVRDILNEEADAAEEAQAVSIRRRRGRKVERPLTVFTTKVVHDVPGSIIFSIMFFLADDLISLAQDGKIRDVGKGKTFAALDNSFWGELGAMMVQFDQFATIAMPPSYKGVTTADSRHIRMLQHRLVQTERQHQVN